MYEVRTITTENGENTILAPANVLPITLFCSTQIWNPQNCLYPIEMNVDGPEQLRIAVGFDHVFVKFKGNRRSNKNFKYADFLVLDCESMVIRKTSIEKLFKNFFNRKKYIRNKKSKNI